MKYIDEYRDAHIVKRIADELNVIATRSWKIMEVCGGADPCHCEVRH